MGGGCYTHSFHIDIFRYENSVTDFALAKYSLVLRAAKRITRVQRKREINAKLDWSLKHQGILIGDHGKLKRFGFYIKGTQRF